MNVLVNCPRCGKPVPMTEMDLADGYERFCDECEAGLPGMYELLQAERRSLDADPDAIEGPGPYNPRYYESEFNIAGVDEILISDIQGDEMWRFTADQVDTLLVELECLLIGLREGDSVNKVSIEQAFDHIKAMRTRRVNAA